MSKQTFWSSDSGSTISLVLQNLLPRKARISIYHHNVSCPFACLHAWHASCAASEGMESFSERIAQYACASCSIPAASMWSWTRTKIHVEGPNFEVFFPPFLPVVFKEKGLVNSRWRSLSSWHVMAMYIDTKTITSQELYWKVDQKTCH